MKAPEQQNALFRSSCVALVMLATARKSAGERVLLAKGYEERKKGEATVPECLHIAYAHSQCASSTTQTAGIPPIHQDLVRSFPIFSQWRWFHCAYGSVGFHYHCIRHVLANRWIECHSFVTRFWLWGNCGVFWIICYPITFSFCCGSKLPRIDRVYRS